MKIHTTITLLTGCCALTLISCANQNLRPQTNIENLERQAPVTGTPNVGQHQAGANAIRYSNDRYRTGLGGGYGYGGGY
ncbi:MAG: hypothetical protein HC845_09635 [Akkermansiaceae bacterium]|nr:hypothetical protein [Akkermansiaceae bacterium]